MEIDFLESCCERGRERSIEEVLNPISFDSENQLANRQHDVRETPHEGHSLNDLVGPPIFFHRNEKEAEVDFKRSVSQRGWSFSLAAIFLPVFKLDRRTEIFDDPPAVFRS